MMINRAQLTTSPEILHCLGSTPDTATVLKWKQDQLEMTRFAQQQRKYSSDFSMLSLLEQQPPPAFQGGLLLGSGEALLNELALTRPIKPDPGMESNWPEFGPTASATITTTTAAIDEYCGITRTISCPPAAMAAAKESLRKRKADNKTLQPSKGGDEIWSKKVKGNWEEEELASKRAEEHSGNSKNGNKGSKNKEGSDGSSSKDNPKQDYIHVRARRGQATDSHSLAERVRREKISERMKYLQDLVPGCNKITGKAGMLDEIINYVQSLQRQVEFLSMKLAAVNPRLDFNIEDLFTKEVCSSNLPAMGVSAEMANLAYLQYSSGQQMDPVCGSDLGMSEAEMGIQRTISAPVSIPEAFTDSSCLTQQIQSCLPWDQADLQSIFNMEFNQPRQQSFPSSQTHTVQIRDNGMMQKAKSTRTEPGTRATAADKEI